MTLQLQITPLLTYKIVFVNAASRSHTFYFFKVFALVRIALETFVLMTAGFTLLKKLEIRLDVKPIIKTPRKKINYVDIPNCLSDQSSLIFAQSKTTTRKNGIKGKKDVLAPFPSQSIPYLNKF